MNELQRFVKVTNHTGVGRAILQPSPNHAFVQFNNQSSVVLNMYANGIWWLLHDNRVFGFRKRAPGPEQYQPTAVDDDHGDYDSKLDVKEVGQNLLLNLLTTPKFRAMSVLFIMFRLLDEIGLLLIIVLSIYNGAFTIPVEKQVLLYSIFGLDLFNDVMKTLHLYWFMQRLSLYIGLVMYVIYLGIIFWYNRQGHYDPDDLNIVIILLAVRFGAFALEECVDIAIDNELHNDLLRVEQQGLANPKLQATTGNPSGTEAQAEVASPLSLKVYLDNTDKCVLHPEVEYVGSFFAWWLRNSVFDKDVGTKNPFSRFSFICLCFFPTLFGIIPILIAAVLCGLAYCVALLGRLCKPNVSASGLWKELRNF